MEGFFTKAIDKLCNKYWIIGLCRDDIKKIIRSKTFNQDITWLPIDSADQFNADPFLLKHTDGNIRVFYEKFIKDCPYGKISIMTVDKNFVRLDQKILLDAKTHLSYPFIFTEDDKIYVFPEASQSGKLSCYEYNPVNQSLNFLKDILPLPLLDSTILKYEEKYWLFGILAGNKNVSNLHLFFSDNLLGPYACCSGNPVKSSKVGTRPAGNFIKVDGEIYRPTQNCESFYGESLTINKIITLNEISFYEEPYMSIYIDRKNQKDHNIHAIHTFNVIDDIIAVDGIKWVFSPAKQWMQYLCNK